MTNSFDESDYVIPNQQIANNQQSQFSDYILPNNGNLTASSLNNPNNLNYDSVANNSYDPRYTTVANYSRSYDDGSGNGDYSNYAGNPGNNYSTYRPGSGNLSSQLALSVGVDLPYSAGYAQIGNNNGSNGGYWERNPAEIYRERQMEHAREQQIQRELYINNTTPRYSYGQDQSNYIPQNYSRPFPPPSYDRNSADYGQNYRRPYRPEPVYVDPRYSTYAPVDTYAARVTSVYPNTDYSTPRNYADNGYDQDSQQVRRRPLDNGQRYDNTAPQASSGAPDLTENSFANGSQYPQGDRQASSAPVGDSATGARRFEQSNGRDASSSSWSQYDWAVYNKLNSEAQKLVGHNIQEYDKGVPIRLGCARAVSLLVEKGYGFDVKDQAIHNLEKDLRGKGFNQVSIKDMKPGDVICGYRGGGDYPHGAVYMGNGKIFNNDSNDGVMEIQSISKYNSSEFKKFVILRRPESVPAVDVASVVDRRGSRPSANQAEQALDDTQNS